MIESPVIQEILAERQREYILKFLEARFGAAAQALDTELKTVKDERLDEVIKLAATCRSKASFRKKLLS